MTLSHPVLALFALTALSARTTLAAQDLRFTSPPELYARGRVSTEFSEIKITFSPDGTRVLWGSTNRPGGPGGWDLWESRKDRAGWSAPAPVPFNSPQFVSTRAKGEWQEPKPLADENGADLYVAPWRDGRYATPVRLGPEVNAEKSWNLGPATHPGEPRPFRRRGPQRRSLVVRGLEMGRGHGRGSRLNLSPSTPDRMDIFGGHAAAPALSPSLFTTATNRATHHFGAALT